MAVTKFEGLFEKPNAFETPIEIRYETVVWTTKMTGMTANSSNLSAFSCEANFVKTVRGQQGSRWAEAYHILRQGVNSATFRFATNFCFSASNMPCLATM